MQFDPNSEIEVDVWFAHAADFMDLSVDACFFSSAEHQRIKALKLPELKQRTTLSTFVLKHLLAFYAQVRAEKIFWKYAPHGKPYLSHQKDIQFNLSHAGPWIVVAIAKHPTLLLGVDIEQHRPCDMHKIAQRFFTKTECLNLKEVPQTKTCQTFFNIWVQKEAFLKATGEGLALGLDQVEVFSNSDQQTAIRAVYAQKWQGPWQAYPLKFSNPEYSGAIVSSQAVKAIHCLAFPSQENCSRYLSASKAAMHPVPAEVTA